MIPSTEALSTLNALPMGKEQALSFAQLIIEQVNSGELNPLKLKAQMKWIEKTLEIIDENTKESQLKEAAKNGAKFNYEGFEVTTGEAGVKYLYENCGDIAWERANTDILSATETKKKREKFLKVLKEKITVVNEETGEVTEVHPPVKTSVTTLKFKMI